MRYRLTTTLTYDINQTFPKLGDLSIPKSVENKKKKIRCRKTYASQLNIHKSLNTSKKFPHRLASRLISL